MLGEITQKSKCVKASGCEEMWLVDGLLAATKLAEESLVSSKAGVEVSTVFGELPSLSLEFEVVRDEGPIERWHPGGNERVFLDPGLIVGLMG